LILSGSAFAIIGSYGTVRFSYFWSRLHAASITDSGGMILLILGMCLQSGLTLITVKLLFIGLFMFITGPTATHAVANAAIVSGLLPTEGKGLTDATPKPPSRTNPVLRGKLNKN
ncbi:MAG: monovalent cation/H(+) antiporter subunit G, partial [Paracoccaceae bacterium]